MVRIQKDILSAIIEKTGYSARHARRIIDKIIESSGYTIPNNRIGANVLASKLGIRINEILHPEELTEVRKYLAEPVVSSMVIHLKNREKKERKTAKIDAKLIEAFGLPKNLEKEALKMAKVYPRFYVLENMLRYAIKKTLEEQYGRDWWQMTGIVSRKIRDKVEGRMNEEKEKRWRNVKRGTHAIFYSDLGDLANIILNNEKTFEKIFGRVDHFQTKLSEIEDMRNIIAHNNPLPLNDIKRLGFYSEELRQQVVSKIGTET
jgi:hypothetical protein